MLKLVHYRNLKCIIKLPEDGQNLKSDDYVNKLCKKKQNVARKYRQNHADLHQQGVKNEITSFKINVIYLIAF